MLLSAFLSLPHAQAEEFTVQQLPTLTQLPGIAADRYLTGGRAVVFRGETPTLGAVIDEGNARPVGDHTVILQSDGDFFVYADLTKDPTAEGTIGPLKNAGARLWMTTADALLQADAEGSLWRIQTDGTSAIVEGAPRVAAIFEADGAIWAGSPMAVARSMDEGKTWEEAKPETFVQEMKAAQAVHRERQSQLQFTERAFAATRQVLAERRDLLLTTPGSWYLGQDRWLVPPGLLAEDAVVVDENLEVKVGLTSACKPATFTRYDTTPGVLELDCEGQDRAYLRSRDALVDAPDSWMVFSPGGSVMVANCQDKRSGACAHKRTKRGWKATDSVERCRAPLAVDAKAFWSKSVNTVSRTPLGDEECEKVARLASQTIHAHFAGNGARYLTASVKEDSQRSLHVHWMKGNALSEAIVIPDASRVAFRDPTQGIALLETELMRVEVAVTSDGGKTWEKTGKHVPSDQHPQCSPDACAAGPWVVRW